MSFEAFLSELRGGWRGPLPALVVLRRVDSTRPLARRLLSLQLERSLPVTPCAVVAWEQTAGRGRQGRGWSSPPGGGAWVSLAVPLGGGDELGALPLLLPVAVCRALERLSVPGCRIKWPNDLLVGGRKLAGLVVEAVSSSRRPRAAVLSFGVNHEPPPGELAATATAVRLEAARAPSLAELVRELVGEVTSALGAAPAARRRELAREFAARSRHRVGDRLRCRVGGSELVGEFRGLDDRGFLRLRVDGEERRIGAAEIVEN